MFKSNVLKLAAVGTVFALAGCQDLKPMQALGYRHIARYLKGLMGLEEALEKIRTDTRHYAKRQLTWFCRDSEIEWHRPQDEGIDARIRELLGG